MRPAHRHLLLATVALLTCAFAVACGTDTRGTPESFASEPSASAPLETLSAEEILTRARDTLENATSFEAVFTATVSGPDGLETHDSIVRMGAPQRYYVRTEDADGISEVMMIDRTYYSRHSATGGTASGRWERETGQLVNDYEYVVSILQKMEEPEVVEVKDGIYLLKGTARSILHRGGFGFSLNLVGGLFTLRVDATTFAPVSASYEMTRVSTPRHDPESQTERDVTYSVEFLSFGEPVTVDAPPAELVDTAVVPTPTSTIVPNPANEPVFVFPVLEDPARFVVRPTPAPLPPGWPTPSVLPTALPPTPVETFLAEIAASEPSNRFEVAPGLIVVYPPCGTDPDEFGRLFAKLYDIGDPDGPEVESSYFVVLIVRDSLPLPGIDYPGNVTTLRLAEVVDNGDLMREVVRRAAPAVRCG